MPVSSSLVSFNTAFTDLFGRAKVSNLESLFNAQFLFDKAPLRWDEILATGGTSTFNANESCIDMAVTTSSGSRVYRQTKEHFLYEPGRVQRGLFTVLFAPATANCNQRVGLFGENDGLFFRLDGLTFGVGIRSSTSGAPVETLVDQSAFNLDKLDGTGPSGATIDLTKNQLLFVEYQWLGVGSIRWGVFIDGAPIYCHQINNSNVGTVVYMKRGNVPVAYEIVNTGIIAGARTLKQICCAVSSDGGEESTGIKRAADTGNVARIVAGTASLPLISIRLKSTAIRSIIIPKAISVMASAADNYRVQLILNGSLTGATFNSVATESIAEFDIAATALTGGTIISSTYVSQVSRSIVSIDPDSLLKCVADIAGTADILTVYVTNITAGINYFGSIEWREYV